MANTFKKQYRSFIFLSIFLTLVGSEAFAVEKKDLYYGKDFYDNVADLRAPSWEGVYIKKHLGRVLRKTHTANADDGFDLIDAKCRSNEALRFGYFVDIFDPILKKETCYKHKVIKYTKARDYIYSNVFGKKSKGKEFVRDVYCEKLYEVNGSNQSKLSVEHSWPQSLFSAAFPRSTQKGDLVALFPANRIANSTRGNSPFGEITTVLKSPCDEKSVINNNYGQRGLSVKGESVFTPPKKIRGAIARALFYFSTRYNMPLLKDQETVLKKWHEQYPVTKKEQKRNEVIFSIQKVRNPYIDYPELVEHINF